MDYSRRSVAKLKEELSRRGTVTTGRKEARVERLEAYDRNQDFRGIPIELPKPVIPRWPVSGFQQLRPMHKILLPKIRREKVEAYFCYRLASDRNMEANSKALEKGELLLSGNRIDACSLHITREDVHMTGIVRAAMKKKVSYNFKLRIHGVTAEVVNTDCECPAGKGPHGTCKHLAAVLLMLCHFMENGEVLIHRTCTEKEQTFHKPSNEYHGSPVKAQLLLKAGKKSPSMDDPRLLKYRRVEGYQDMVRNHVLNMCANTSVDITTRFLYQKADLQEAVWDHNYLKRPFTVYWVQEKVQVPPEQVTEIEKYTRMQTKSKKWFREREWRITASRFGDVCKATLRRNKTKLCEAIVSPPELKTKPVIHGRTYEKVAIEKFQKIYDVTVRPCGLFISHEHPFLAATPDGVIDFDHIVEVKCPYNGRDCNVEPGPKFPFLEHRNGEIRLGIQ